MEDKTYWLMEQLRTIRNLTEISQILLNISRKDLLPTVLELMYLEVQDIVDANCIEE